MMRKNQHFERTVTCPCSLEEFDSLMDQLKDDLHDRWTASDGESVLRFDRLGAELEDWPMPETALDYLISTDTHRLSTWIVVSGRLQDANNGELAGIVRVGGATATIEARKVPSGSTRVRFVDSFHPLQEFITCEDDYFSVVAIGPPFEEFAEMLVTQYLVPLAPLSRVTGDRQRSDTESAESSLEAESAEPPQSVATTSKPVDKPEKPHARPDDRQGWLRWFMYRSDMLQAGYKYTLKELAKELGYSYGYIRQKHAEYKHEPEPSDES